ncbi:MFS transporter [Paenibacillus sp. LHD-117]|nr:MFS transporter [Paenibacillus sp. LHD-117]MDQ6421199.1 MFS transporter [Paenibacillus sp. LHD-117]
MKLFKQHIDPEQLQSSMALFQSLVAIFMVIGPSIGVACYQMLGIRWSVAIMGIAFLLSALVLFRIPPDREVEREVALEGGTRRFWVELKDGFQYVWRSPVLKSLGGTFALAGIAVGIVQTLGLFIVTDRLGQEKEFLQFLLMTYGIAMMIGGGAVMALAKKISPQKLLALGMLCISISMVGVGISTNIPLTFALQRSRVSLRSDRHKHAHPAVFRGAVCRPGQRSFDADVYGHDGADDARVQQSAKARRSARRHLLRRGNGHVPRHAAARAALQA